jgi:hypothetical protein
MTYCGRGLRDGCLRSCARRCSTHSPMTISIGLRRRIKHSSRSSSCTARETRAGTRVVSSGVWSFESVNFGRPTEEDVTAVTIGSNDTNINGFRQAKTLALKC